MWVIVVLAAVFSMHGLRCVTADANVDNASMGSMHGSALTLPDSVFSTHLPVPMDAHDGGVDLGSAPADDGPAGNGAVHTWAVCSVIAVAGLVLLPVLALLRSWTSVARSGRGLVRATVVAPGPPVPSA